MPDIIRLGDPLLPSGNGDDMYRDTPPRYRMIDTAHQSMLALTLQLIARIALDAT